ncbi:MAG: DNA topoisomerase, partial [Myxococcales bacterium]|nr:DNA topoisomerase [Myxococcales bacterium]
SLGTCYTARFADIPASTGHGEPIQKLFKLKDGEAIVSALSLDPRIVGELDGSEDHYPETFGVAASTDGYGLCFGLAPFAEPSTRSGRRYAKPSKGHRMLNVAAVTGDETLIAASKGRRALLCAVTEVNYLSGAGKGVMLMKLGKDDELIGFLAAKGDGDTLTLKTSLGGEQRVNLNRYELTGRGGKGREVIKRGQLIGVVREVPVAPPVFADAEA